MDLGQVHSTSIEHSAYKVIEYTAGLGLATAQIAAFSIFKPLKKSQIMHL